MALTDKKITDLQINSNGVVSAPDKLTGTAAETHKFQPPKQSISLNNLPSHPHL